jgi:hypothetical protein
LGGGLEVPSVGAQYLIVQGKAGAERRLVPEVAGVLIVSIRPDGYRVYPIDKTLAIDTYHAMHEWWVAQRIFVESKAVGQPWAPISTVGAEPIAATVDPGVDSFTSTPVDRAGSDSQGGAVTASPELVQPEGPGPAIQEGNGQMSNAVGQPTPGPAPDPSPIDFRAIRREQLLIQYQNLPEPDRLAFKALQIEPSDLDAVEAGLRQVDPFYRTRPEPPVEGKNVAPDVYNDMATSIQTLPPEQREILNRVAKEANSSLYGSISLKQLPSRRRWEIARALVSWLRAGWDDELFVAALVHIGAPCVDTPADVSFAGPGRPPGTPLGALVAQLSIDQAKALGDLAQALLGGEVFVEYDESSGWLIRPLEPAATQDEFPW